MSGLRERIEAHMADLRAEREVAEAASTDPFIEDRHWRHGFLITGAVGEHIAFQSPERVIARIDRELAGCAADLALLDDLGGDERSVWLNTDAAQAVLTNLLARYPEGAS